MSCYPNGLWGQSLSATIVVRCKTLKPVYFIKKYLFNNKAIYMHSKTWLILKLVKAMVYCENTWSTFCVVKTYGLKIVNSS
jgi:hypothetical protein